MKLRRCFLSAAGAALAAALTAPVPAAVPDPYQIFANAREYWLYQHYPAELQYQVAVDITEGGKERVERYDVLYDAVKNDVDVDPVSDYERAHPVKPTGVNLNFALPFGLGMPIGKPLPSIDFLGVPKLAPAYSFGMAPFVPAPTPTPFNSMALVEEIRKEFHDPDPRKPTPSPSPSPGLPEIATVVAENRDYTISLVGTESIAGHPCYHLALKPMRDPGRFRIREAWIDEVTYAPWQLRDATNFQNGPPTSVPWTIAFVDIGGAHYIAQEQADAPISSHGEIYTRASIRFESVVASTKAPPARLTGDTPGEVLDEP
jgi:hypothetical protein